jgi:hypothetical protein
MLGNPAEFFCHAFVLDRSIAVKSGLFLPEMQMRRSSAFVLVGLILSPSVLGSERSAFPLTKHGNM